MVIGRQRLSLKKAPNTVNLRVTGPTRCPGGARSSTRWGGRRDRRAATRRRPPGTTRRRPVYAALQSRARQRVSLAGMSLNRRETSFFAHISKAPRGHYDEGRAEHLSRRHSLLKIGWLPMDASHLAEHAGAASSFFASMFVVATLSMRTMIPLRVSEHAQLRANVSRECVMSQCRPRESGDP